MKTTQTLYRRVIATCSCCGHEFTEIPPGAKSTRNGALTTYDFDCACRPGMANGIEVVTKDGVPLTQSGLAFELAKHGAKL